MYRTIFGKTQARFHTANNCVEFQIPGYNIIYVVSIDYFFGFMQAKQVV